MEVAKVGTMRLQFAAMSNAGRDATQISIPVHYPATSKAFADYLRSEGHDVTLKVYPGAGHGFIYDAHPARRHVAARAYRAMYKFLLRHDAAPRTVPPPPVG